jgi:hypothetical protein
MLNKIKYLGIIFLSILLLTNCKKDAKQDQVKQGELAFAPIDITPDKTVWDWECDLTLTVKYAKVTIDGQDYYPLTFVLDGKLYTQAIKLDAGDYVLEYFALMDDMDTPDSKLDDEIVKATPMDDSDFAGFVEYTLPKAITIIAFQKFELKIDVLCYIPAIYEYFGFFWFEVIEMTIREQCFFGDFCLPNLTDYEGSLYDLNGLLIDEVAIFKIRVIRNDEPLGFHFNTVEGDGITFKEPLCIQYADYDNAEDHFEFELWIYVKVGDEFEYVLFHVWEFDDDEKIDTGGDGIVEFVLGDCVYSPTDFLFPPYVNSCSSHISTPISVIDGGDTTFYDDGGMLIENMITEWYDQGEDWRNEGISIWYITFLFAPDGSAEMWGTGEIFVGSDPGNPAYVGKWDLIFEAVLTPTDVGFDLLTYSTGVGVEGVVLGFYGAWISTMNNDFSNPSTFMYNTYGCINSQVPLGD